MDDFTAPLPPAAAHTPERVSRGASSAAGAVRPENQDAFALAPRGAGEARLGTLAALADGVGGRPGGASASREAVRYLQALYYAGVGPRQPGERLRAAVEAVNVLSRLSARRLPQAVPAPAAGPLAADEAPLTTLVAAVVHNGRVWVANVGDSRAYLVRANAGQVQRLTEDHRPVPGEVEPATGPLDAGRGVQSPANASGAGVNAPARVAQRGGPRSAPAENVISRAIGLDDTCQVDLYTYAWQPGDRLVLCSDGLSRLPLDAMAQVVLGAPPAQAAEQLVAEAVRRDGSDNCTAVVLGWEARPARGAATATRARPGPRSPRPELTTLAAALLGLILGWLSAALVAILYLAARAGGLLGS